MYRNPDPSIGTVPSLESRIKACALELGFDLVGIAPARPSAHGARILQWLADGHHATMHYMERNIERRLDVRVSLPSAQSVVMVAVSCFSSATSSPDEAIFAMYARNEDYHDWMKPRLRALATHIERMSEDPVEWRAFADSSPVLEREVAHLAGLGWIGKNSMLINRRYGSHILLGGLMLSLELEPDLPYDGRCGRCRRCLDACPTGAIVRPGTVDARRCIAYHTIESREPIPPDIASAMGNRVFGCDICQEVCPFNITCVPHTRHEAFRPRPATLHRSLEELATLSDEDFREQFRRSPVRRTKAAGLRRNAEAALRNRRSQ